LIPDKGGEGRISLQGDDKAIWQAESFELEVWNVTIGDWLDQPAQKRPDQEALVYHYPELILNLRRTYRQYQVSQRFFGIGN
jgi:hypothetical protein